MLYARYAEPYGISSDWLTIAESGTTTNAQMTGLRVKSKGDPDGELGGIHIDGYDRCHFDGLTYMNSSMPLVISTAQKGIVGPVFTDFCWYPTKEIPDAAIVYRGAFRNGIVGHHMRISRAYAQHLVSQVIPDHNGQGREFTSCSWNHHETHNSNWAGSVMNNCHMNTRGKWGRLAQQQPADGTLFRAWDA